MLNRLASICLVGTALAITPTLAATTTTTAPAVTNAATEAGFMTQLTADEWRAPKLVGIDVYGTDNAKIGDIRDLIIDKNGTIHAVVIGVGGFLGIGEKDVAVPFTTLRWTDDANTNNKMTTTTTTTTNTVGNTTTGATPPVAPGMTAANPDPTLAPGATRTTDTTMRGYPDRAWLDMTKDQLKAAPAFRYSSTAMNQ
jgi:sporulation protein YlmC with PRC-barrel domain